MQVTPDRIQAIMKERIELGILVHTGTKFTYARVRVATIGAIVGAMYYLALEHGIKLPLPWEL